MARNKRKQGRTRTKNPKKLGKDGEIVISEFAGAVNSLKNRYNVIFPDLVLFSHFNALGKNFVFQKIQSFPLTRVIYTLDTHSIEFKAKWTAGGALPYLFPKTSAEIEIKEGGKEIGWGEVANFFPRTLYGEKIMRANKWVDIDDADYMDAGLDIRIDHIKSINMYNWGFELIGDIVSLIAINKNYAPANFPKTISLDIDNLTFGFESSTGQDVLEVRWSQQGYEPTRGATTDFDKLLFGEDNKEVLPEIKVKNLGQRCMKNLILED